MRGIEIPTFFDFIDGRMKVFCMPLIRRSDVVMQDFRPCLAIINLDKAKVLMYTTLRRTMFPRRCRN